MALYPRRPWEFVGVPGEGSGKLNRRAKRQFEKPPARHSASWIEQFCEWPCLDDAPSVSVGICPDCEFTRRPNSGQRFTMWDGGWHELL